MNKATDEELVRRFDRAYLKRSEEGDPDRTYVSDCRRAACRALHDAGIAHGWREAIEELRAYSQRGERTIHEAGAQQDAANHLESIAKERGYL